MNLRILYFSITFARQLLHKLSYSAVDMAPYRKKVTTNNTKERDSW